MVQLGPAHSNKPPTTVGTAQENPSTSQSVAAEKRIHTIESSTSKADVLAQINEARQRSLSIPSSSFWVNDAALMNVGLEMHRVRYVTRRTVVAVRNKRPHRSPKILDHLAPELRVASEVRHL